MSKNRKFDLPDAVRRRALTEGDQGQVWLAELDQVIASLESDWALAVGQTLGGGSASFVAEAKTENGQNVILKVSTLGSDAGSQGIFVLSAAQGRGYVQLLRHDTKRRALLLERLGSNLGQLHLPIQKQIEILCAALLEAWQPTPKQSAPDSPTFVTGQEKALGLASFIEEAWETTGKPCSAAVIQQARSYALQRASTFAPSTAVLAHGDPHAGNLLVVPGTNSTDFKFVDPDGLLIEPAYDLGVMLRSWNAELLEGNAAELAWERTRFVSQITGVEKQAIWQWNFIERVSTGLTLKIMGSDPLAQEFLTVSERITSFNP